MKRQTIWILCTVLLISLSACTQPGTSRGTDTGKEPNDGASANQDAWEQGVVPPELQRKSEQSKNLPPVEAEQSTTSTTAATGEMESVPTKSPYGKKSLKEGR